jgi:PPOX class probable F420-dependent enzyme
MAIAQSVRRMVESGRPAQLVTLNRDGGPQVTAVWVGIENDEIVCGHLGAWQQAKNVRPDPRVALSIETDQTNATGLQEYLVVYGTARITDGGAAELQRLVKRNLGRRVKFPPLDNPPPGYVTRIAPERYAGVGPRTER